jgi:dTDP-D-glucose 4,6-dehydratase
MVLHGDGSHKRRYLFAADAVDAFDTILHRGEIGHVYNVGSHDEISNMELCTLLLETTNIPFQTQAEFDKWVKHTRDRPFNDQRYAVDDSKLRQLGWVQKTSIQKGLTITLNWYSQFGEKWWGNISNVLSPYPTIDRSCEAPQSSVD